MMEDVGRLPGQARRLLYVTPRFLPDLGGTEVHTYEVARRLAVRGDSVTVLTTDPGGLPAREELDGIEILRVPARPAGKDLRFAPGIARVVGGSRWDIVHCQGYHTLVPPLAMLAALRAGVPYVLSFHSGGHSARWRHRIRSAQAAALRPLARRAAALVAVSRFEAWLFSRRLGLSPERIAVIPNGAELPEPPASVSEEEGLIVSVGRLERYKGHQHAIRALPYVKRSIPAVRLVIVGTGPYEAQLREVARATAVPELVTHVSFSSEERQQLAALLASASLVLLLSEYESHGVAALEAAALGRPVLVSDQSALRDAVEDGWAVGVSPSASPQELAIRISELLERPPQLEPPPDHTWEGCAARLSELYDRVLAERPQADDAAPKRSSRA